MAHLFEKRPSRPYKGLVITGAVFLGIIALFALMIGSVGKTANREQGALLEAAIRNAAVSSYATEGRYPDTLERIVKEYGVIIDHDRFHVRYEVFAANIMPEIYVVARGEKGT